MKKKLKEWLKRYLPAEISGTITAMIAAIITYLLTNNRIISAYAGTMGENIGYYGVIFVREHLIDYKQSRNQGQKHTT
ncbi:MAG: phage holin family protein, partial [Nanoarchaeota archaeon]|nr:phage holin family protein [Nanoarchaeota archaeon]